ncbi:MAG: DsbE family thiol:disulfide interchange protein [Gammaproteobacteria bacterium]|nr:DsbE family thiol:disulfide interchange protein [Gammaproteobacteria bacterium]
MKKRYLIPFGIFMAIMAIFVLGLYRMGEDPNFTRNVPSVLIGKQAPKIDLPDLFDQSKTVSSSSLAGQVWVLNVWATWCPECWREHAFLVHLARNEGVKLFGIDWRDDAAAAKRLLVDKGNPFVAVGFDPESRAIMDWGVYGAPETFVIDKQGVVRWKKAGAMTRELWESELKPLLQKLEKG